MFDSPDLKWNYLRNFFVAGYLYKAMIHYFTWYQSNAKESMKLQF